MPEVNKEQSVEIQNESSPAANIYEFNSFVSPMDISSLFSCGIYDYFSKEEIDSILRDPIGNHDAAIRLSNFVYTKNGIVSNSVDYMTALPCLDRILISKNKRNTKTVQANKALMKSVLEKIDDRQFIRNALFTDMLDGIAFFYFETKKKNYDKSKFMTDYDVENIVEINEVGINASIISLPWKYTKIVGKKNGRYVLAFNLRYFDDYRRQAGKKIKKISRRNCKSIQ